MSEATPNPTIDANGLPLCNQDGCGLYDGKRCSALGFRPDRFCEPGLIAVVADRKVLKRRVAELEGIQTEQAAKLRRHLDELAEARAAVTIEAAPPEDLLDRITPDHACRHTRRNLRPNPHGVPVTTCIDCGDEIP